MMKKIILIGLLVMIILISGCAQEEITNFEECIAAGNPAMESYPRQCTDGVNTFTEEIKCVPATCCHASSCVLEANAPDCSQIACSMECEEGTMDCGQGQCVFDMGVEGNCKVEWV